MAVDLKKTGLITLLFLLLVAFGAALYATSSRFENYGYLKVHGVISGYETSLSGCTKKACYYNTYAVVQYSTNQLCYIQTAFSTLDNSTAIMKTETDYPTGEKVTVYRKEGTTTCLTQQVGNGKAIAGVVLLVIAGLMIVLFPLYFKLLILNPDLDKIAPTSESLKTNRVPSIV